MARILFVCTGNTCRSPMAEAILKSKEIPGVEVKSAGVYAPNGAEASLNAKIVLEENNISHDHRSSTLTKEQIEWATLVLTMTQSHKQLILSQYPQAADKTFTLKEFAEVKENLDVADPFGGNEQIYREAFQEIQESIERILDKIR
ncbi:low molecular weight protein arginine phosphatase [Mesobacillus subterraneus]|uniref:Low molecular weight protein arginine phosphatase n=1 Tax=Mesobacillus subterraneus TaxID=285983 RepID=A0A427TRV4_9BACI|nr:low molecular weight protein arginine phosphatase [Mesobacillus subterraneus]RSD27142.1 low molecular weight protein arginine phosphatase [Mesobacillus subterraneus]